MSSSVPKIIYFWNPDSKYGFLSNWYPCEFEDFDLPIDNKGNYRKFSSVQQYMIYHRVNLFGDKETIEKVLQTNDPNELKKIGTQIKNFDVNIWNQHKERIAMKGVYLKFKQNPELCEQFLDTGDSVLAESSKWDKNWGIGMDKKTAMKVNDPSKWTGKNLLGKCLMEVRDYLRQELLVKSGKMGPYKDDTDVTEMEIDDDL